MTINSSHAASATKTYLAIWGWLAALMLLGVLLSERAILPFPRWGIIFIVLILSTIKAALVGMYYMHLKSERRLLAFIALGPLVLIAMVMGVLFSSRLIHF